MQRPFEFQKAFVIDKRPYLYFQKFPSIGGVAKIQRIFDGVVKTNLQNQNHKFPLAISHFNIFQISAAALPPPKSEKKNISKKSIKIQNKKKASDTYKNPKENGQT